MVSVADGIVLRMCLTGDRSDAFAARRRRFVGPAGCGMCGLESLAEANRSIPLASCDLQVTRQDIEEAVAALPARQQLNIQTRAVHAAAFWRPDQEPGSCAKTWVGTMRSTNWRAHCCAKASRLLDRHHCTVEPDLHRARAESRHDRSGYHSRDLCADGFGGPHCGVERASPSSASHATTGSRCSPIPRESHHNGEDLSMDFDCTAALPATVRLHRLVPYHFPAFTIGLAAWLTVLEALHQWTGRPAYRVVFEFWLKIFGVAFGLGVVSGIVMAFEFGTNWSELSQDVRADPGTASHLTRPLPLLLSRRRFFGILLFGRSRVPPWFYLLLDRRWWRLGTTFSAFWIMVNNSWMQVPVGYAMEHGIAVAPNDWTAISFQPGGLGSISPHAACLLSDRSAFCVAATGAWYFLRSKYLVEAQIMLRMGLYPRRRAGAGPAPLWTFRRRLRPQRSAGEICGDRGSLA